MGDPAIQPQTSSGAQPPAAPAAGTPPAKPAVVTSPLEASKVDATKPAETKPPPASTKPPDPQAQKDSQRFHVINQQTKKLIADRASVKRDREQFLAEKAQHDAELKEARELKALIEAAKRNPEALQKRVYGDKWYETLTNYVTADKQVTAELVAKDIDERVGHRLSELEKRIEADKKAQAQAQLRAAAAADRQTEIAFAQQAILFVDKNAEKYPMTVRTKNQWRVPDLVKRNFDATGEMIDPEEAAAAVEKYITEVEAPLYSPSAKPGESTEKPAAKPAPATQEPPRSLNNDMAVSTPQTFYVGPSSDDEATKRALAAYRANRSVRQ